MHVEADTAEAATEQFGEVQPAGFGGYEVVRTESDEANNDPDWDRFGRVEE